jgi:very-short-patch-repair endonuclease
MVQSKRADALAYVRFRTRAHARALRRRLTDAETILWWRLRRLPDLRFRRQHPVGPFIADFASVAARLVIEIDGATHATDAERERDAQRDAYLSARGWRILRIPNAHVYDASDEVADMICAVASARLRR